MQPCFSWPFPPIDTFLSVSGSRNGCIFAYKNPAYCAVLEDPPTQLHALSGLSISYVGSFHSCADDISLFCLLLFYVGQ